MRQGQEKVLIKKRNREREGRVQAVTVSDVGDMGNSTGRHLWGGGMSGRKNLFVNVVDCCSQL